MSVKEKDKIIVYGRCGNRCAFPGCNQIIIDKEKSKNYYKVGNLAHIKGNKLGSKRYDSTQTDEERNSSDNLILLCATHHKIIDDQDDIYTVEKLEEIKIKHEKRVISEIKKSINLITFNELEIIIKYILLTDLIESDMSVTHLKDKIEKNDLSTKTQDLIKIGLSKTRFVKQYIDRNLDPEFGERLKIGFVKQYNDLKGIYEGDALFDLLLDFACGKSSKFKEMAAGLSVLCYFFENCDVLKK